MFPCRCIVKSYLDRCGRKETTCQELIGFMSRHKAVLTQRTAKNISKTDEQVVNNFFHNLEKELSGIPKTNIWNYDETNLVDHPGAGKIITKRGTKYPERIQNSSKACRSSGTTLRKLQGPENLVNVDRKRSPWYSVQ